MEKIIMRYPNVTTPTEISKEWDTLNWVKKNEKNEQSLRDCTDCTDCREFENEWELLALGKYKNWVSIKKSYFSNLLEPILALRRCNIYTWNFIHFMEVKDGNKPEKARKSLIGSMETAERTGRLSRVAIYSSSLIAAAVPLGASGTSSPQAAITTSLRGLSR